MIISGVYKITNKINGKIYVGKSKDVENRWKQHQRLSEDSLLHIAMRKYGIKNFEFELLEACPISELDKKEMEYIRRLNTFVGRGHRSDAWGYNLTLGGDGGSTIMVDEIGICVFYKEGLSVDEIAERYEVSNSVILRILEKYQVHVRNNSEQRAAKKAYNRRYIWPKFIAGEAIDELAAEFILKHKKVVKYLQELKPIELSLEIFINMLKNSGATEEEIQSCIN